MVADEPMGGAVDLCWRRGADTLLAPTLSGQRMAPNPPASVTMPPDGGYAEACALWQIALDQYLRLAREGAAGSRLRAAAAAVQAAASRKGRLALAYERSEG